MGLERGRGKSGIAEAKKGNKRGWLGGDGWLSTPCDAIKKFNEDVEREITKERLCKDIERHGQISPTAKPNDSDRIAGSMERSAESQNGGDEARTTRM